MQNSDRSWDNVKTIMAIVMAGLLLFGVIAAEIKFKYDCYNGNIGACFLVSGGRR